MYEDVVRFIGPELEPIERYTTRESATCAGISARLAEIQTMLEEIEGMSEFGGQKELTEHLRKMYRYIDSTAMLVGEIKQRLTGLEKEVDKRSGRGISTLFKRNAPQQKLNSSDYTFKTDDLITLFGLN